MQESKDIAAIVIGTSAGGLEALSAILTDLPDNYPLPILVVIHLPPNKTSIIADILNEKCAMSVVEAYDKDSIQPGYIYFAPPNYHMMVEMDKTISLSTDEPIQYSRPSIDVLFETAAEAYNEHLLGIVLTGANSDGALGLQKVMECGGQGIIQDPNSCLLYTSPSPRD